MASPFELLLNVCNREREALDAQRRAAQDAKKSSRKQNGSSEPLTFNEIKALSSKSLVDRYAKFTSDEMNKKYAYQCRLLPGKCHEMFKSYGNEKKAWERMKTHLGNHLKEHSSEIDVSVFAKSPSEDAKLTYSKDVQKSPKKPRMEPQPSSSSSDSQTSCDPPRPPARCPAKKMLEFNGHKPQASKRKKYTPKPISKLVDRNLPIIRSLEYPPYDDEVQNGSSRIIYSSTDSEDSQSSICSSLDDFEQRDGPWSDDESSSYLSTNTACAAYLPDHDYHISSTTYVYESDDESSEIYLRQRRPHRKIKKQFIIPSPPFPYLHDPVEFVVTEIAEVDEFSNKVRNKQQRDGISCLDIDRYVLSKEDAEKRSFEQKSFYFNYQTQDVTGSVLECVENKFQATHPEFGNKMTKFKCYPSTSNDENSENVQRVNKEIAMRHIAQLNSKRKKNNPGPLQCQLCTESRQFTAVASLMHHYRSHAGIKLFVCNICNDTFTRQHSLNYHMMIHQNQSRFCCEFCQRNFRHPSHFKEHLRRHTGETPFQCSFCNMLFKTRNTFKRHLRMQHKKILTAHGIEDDKGEGQSGRKLKRNVQ